MWLLSACTNFLVTASSMICFTYKRQKERVRDQVRSRGRQQHNREARQSNDGAKTHEIGETA